MSNKKQDSDDETTPDFSRIEQTPSRKTSFGDLDDFTKIQSSKGLSSFKISEDDIQGNINYCQSHKKLLYNFCSSCEMGICNDCFKNHKKHEVEPLELVTKSHITECNNIVDVIEDERRRLKEKLRVKKAMRAQRKKQLMDFFEACEQELQRVKRDYTIDLENDDLMFEQDFETLQDRISNITKEINKCRMDSDIYSLEHEYHQYELYFQARTNLGNIMKYVQLIIEEAEAPEMNDYLITYNREDLRDRIDALCNMSLKHKQNTSLFDFNFENNRIIKTEVVGKTSLRAYLNDEGDEYKVGGCRNVKTFINGPDVSKSLLDISGNFTPDRNVSMRRGHHRKTSSVANSIFDQSVLMKGPSNKHIDKKQCEKFTEVQAIRRDLKLVRDVFIPRKPSILSLKEGRIFFIGGVLNDKTSNRFIEYIEETNLLIYHPDMKYERQSLATCFVNNRIYAVGGYHFGSHQWLDSIEHIRLPEVPEYEYQNNYNILTMYEPPMSNQFSISPRGEWSQSEAKMKLARSHLSCTASLEKFIYIFCGKYGEPDAMQPTITNVKSSYVIERYDTVTDECEEYVIKSCHKISACYSPGTIPAFSSRRKNPGILFFGGKTDFQQKNLTKISNKVYIMFPQDKNKARQLEAKYWIKGCQLKVKAEAPEILQKSKKSKEKDQPIEIELFNGDIECLRRIDMYSEDTHHFYFLGCRDRCEKLELEDSNVQEHKEIIDKIFAKHQDHQIQCNILRDENIKQVHESLFGVDSLKFNNFEHPRHGHSLFMLDKATLKWSSIPVVKYVPNNKFY